MQLEANEREEETRLVTCSSQLEAEYLAKQEEVMNMEVKLVSVTDAIAEVRALNISLALKNIELDRDDRQVQGTLMKAKELVTHCVLSQCDLDREFESQLCKCDQFRSKAKNQAERLTEELGRLEVGRSRLSEVCHQPSAETSRVLEETDIFVKQIRDALHAATVVAEHGIRLSETNTSLTCGSEASFHSVQSQLELAEGTPHPGVRAG